MSEKLSNIKLSIEALQRLKIYPEISELETFLEQEETRLLIARFIVQLGKAWYKRDQENTEQEIKDFQQKQIIESQKVSLEKKLSEKNLSDTAYKDLEPESSISETSPQSLPSDSESAAAMQPTQPNIRFKLPNATVGKSYAAVVESNSPQAINVLAIQGLEELGLSFNPVENTLTGEPSKAGEHQLLISYQSENNTGDIPETASFNLVINNDPRSLWKNIPSDKEVKYWKPDSDCLGSEGLYGWKIAAASQRGRSHAHVGSCRDDDFALQVNHQALWHIVAVADGAGSSEYSRKGAEVIVNNSVEILSSQLQQADESLNELLAQWQQENTDENQQALNQALYSIFQPTIADCVEKLKTLAEEDEKSYRDYYSTLLIAAHKPLASGQFTVAYWIGDGVVGIYQQQKGIHLLGDGDSGEYAGQTRFLDIDACDEEDLQHRIRFSFDKDFTALVLMTDGITDPLFETDNRLKSLTDWDDFWQQQIKEKLTESPQESAENLLAWLDFWSSGNHDDRTIALLYRA